MDFQALTFANRNAIVGINSIEYSDVAGHRYIVLHTNSKNRTNTLVTLTNGEYEFRSSTASFKIITQASPGGVMIDGNANGATVFVWLDTLSYFPFYTLEVSTRISALFNNVLYGGGYQQRVAETTPYTIVGAIYVPTAPTNVTASMSSAGALSVSWSPSTTQEAATVVTGYNVRCYFGASTPSNTPVASIDVSGTSHVFTGLVSTRAYTVKVSAMTRKSSPILVTGKGPDGTVNSTPAPIPSIPAAPIYVVGDFGPGSAVVFWDQPTPVPGGEATYYTVTAWSEGLFIRDISTNTTSAVFEPLTNGQTYTFQVTASNAVGTSPPSAAPEPVTPLSTPSVPLNVRAVPGSGTATISWTTPSDSGGKPITGYSVVRSGNTTPLTTTGTSVQFSGLNLGATYTFSVVAKNERGDSQPSSVTAIIADRPFAPTGVTVADGNRVAKVSWTAPTVTGSSPITEYTVVATAVTGGITITRSATSSPMRFTGLAMLTQYTFTVKAVNSSGEGPASAASAAFQMRVAVDVASATPFPGVSNSVDLVLVVTNGSGTTYQMKGGLGTLKVKNHNASLSQVNQYSPLIAMINGIPPSGPRSTMYDVSEYSVTLNLPPAHIGAAVTQFVHTTSFIIGAPEIPDIPSCQLTAPGNVLVTWTAPHLNSAAITGYRLQRYVNGIASGDSIDAGPQVSYTVSDISAGTYTFKVSASNMFGASAYSAASAPVTVSLPTNVTSSYTDGVVTVSWTAPANSSGVTGYSVAAYAGTGTTPVSTTTVATTTTSTTVAGLSLGSTYTFKVAASNASGVGSYSNASAPLSLTTIPSAPTLGLADVSDGYVTLYWNTPAANGSPILKYRITDGSGSTYDASGNSNSRTISGLVNGQTYIFSIAAQNAIGYSLESVVSQPLTPFGKPGATRFVSVLAGNTTVALNWAQPEQTGGSPILSYSLQANGGTAIPLGPTTTSHTVTGLTNGTTYTFSLTASNVYGTGTAVTSVSVTPSGPTTPPKQFVKTALDSELNNATGPAVIQHKNVDFSTIAPSIPSTVSVTAIAAKSGDIVPVESIADVLYIGLQSGFVTLTIGGQSYLFTFGVDTVTITMPGGTIVNAVVGDTIVLGGELFTIASLGSVTLYKGVLNSNPICFFADAPVLTPSGYRRIDSLREGDLVSTPCGGSVAIERVKVMRCAAGPSSNPFVIPKGTYGATQRLLISPRHRVQTENGMVEARDLGLKQEMHSGELTYYNLGLPAWENMIVAGVTVESLAPVQRITIPFAEFKALLTKKHGSGPLTAAALQNIKKSCRFLANGHVECPVIKKF